jgi:protease IV
MLAAALSVAFAAAGGKSSVSEGAPPPKLTDGVPTPGRSVASGDDSTALAQNPANLAFLPAPEVRWTWAFTQSAAPLPLRGHAVDAAMPFWFLATGLRVDLMDPPRAAPPPFSDPYQMIRWGFAARAGQMASFGTTLGWSLSETTALDGQFSLTSGLTLRPWPYLSVAAVARDWNQPTSRNGFGTERSYDLGIAGRPILGLRALEIGAGAEFYESSEEWLPRATLGVDVPRIGRLRGDLEIRDLAEDASFVAMAGLDINVGALQVAGGGIFGDGVTKSGTGFYAGLAIRAYREPGMNLPSRVARIRIDSTPGVRQHTRLMRTLWSIQEDPEVEGVLLLIRAEPSPTIAYAEELGDAIRGIRARGKKVICHLEDAGGASLFACSQADRISINPAGGIRFAGLSSRYIYFGGLLDKLAVRADFVRIGRHKLAPEQFARRSGTEIARADHQELVDEFAELYLHDVGGGRRIPRSVLERRIAGGPFIATEARDNGLVDTLAFEDELDQVVEEVMGGPVRITDHDPLPSAPDHWGKVPKVALVYLAGDMIDGESMYIPFVGIRLAGSRTISQALRQAREDPSVKAVVFRIETGGGSSLAADVILREAILTARRKPLVVSMAGSAASGGYYAAVAGKPIFANRGTITGSIGIFYGKVDVSGLLNKVGVTTEAFRSAPRADAESLFRPFTDDERRILGVKVKQFYDTFVGRVSEGRGMTPEAVDAVGRGKVWIGAQAHEVGLVDRIGGLRQALDEARMLGGLPMDSPIVELPEESDSLLGFVLQLVGFSTAATPAGSALALLPPQMLDVARALMPFVIYEPTLPLARVELFERMTFGKAPTRAPDEMP